MTSRPLQSESRAGSLTRHLAFAASCGVGVAAAMFVIAGCNELFSPAGQPIECTITGEVVGVDGEPVTKLDIGWFPEPQPGQSDGLVKGTVNENMFTITELLIADEAQVVEGELGFSDVPTPPFPQQYDQVRVPIELEIDDCVQDLGVIELPLRGTSPDPDAGIDPVNDAGANNGTADAGID